MAVNPFSFSYLVPIATSKKVKNVGLFTCLSKIHKQDCLVILKS